MVTLAMLERGEAPDSPRVVAESGAAMLTGLHYLVARHLETGEDPPEYYSFLDPEEARFITAELIRATCLTGTPEELVEQVRALDYPPLNRQYRVIEDFAEKVMARL